MEKIVILHTDVAPDAGEDELDTLTGRNLSPGDDSRWATSRLCCLLSWI